MDDFQKVLMLLGSAQLELFKRTVERDEAVKLLNEYAKELMRLKQDEKGDGDEL